jgi:hypothetical protein
MSASHTPAPRNADDNLDDLGRDLRTGKTRPEQHPQQELEIGKQKPVDDGLQSSTGKSGRHS